MNNRILIIEDNAIARRVEKTIFLNLGCYVDCVASGEDGVKMASENQYDLIIMDLGLPGIDGIKATELIRESGNLTPIVAVTANEDISMRETCIKSGMNEVFSKPFNDVTAKELLNSFCIKLAI